MGRVIELIRKYRSVFIIIFIFIKEGCKFIFTLDKNKFFINFVESLANKNIFYVKLFQIFGTNTKYFNKNARSYLIKYLDNVPFTKCEENIIELNDTIQRVSAENSELTINIETITQINSGMIAIVYKAKMSNKDVIIKVIKNNIHSKIKDSLDVCDFIIWCIHKLPGLKYYYFKDIFNENKQSIIEQLDFNKELNNLIKFKYDNRKHRLYCYTHSI